MKQRSLIAAFLALASLASIAGQTFQMDQKAYVPFDASTTVSVECPDATAAAWLASHLKEWYGGSAPRVASGETGLTAEGDEGYAANVGDTLSELVDIDAASDSKFFRVGVGYSAP